MEDKKKIILALVVLVILALVVFIATRSNESVVEPVVPEMEYPGEEYFPEEFEPGPVGGEEFYPPEETFTPEMDEEGYIYIEENPELEANGESALPAEPEPEI